MLIRLVSNAAIVLCNRPTGHEMPLTVPHIQIATIEELDSLETLIA
jgi:hypothetical protein